MRYVSWLKVLVVAVSLFVVLPAPRGFAQSTRDITLGKNFEIIVLHPGLSRTISYKLHNPLTRDRTAVHVTLIVTFGAGLLNVTMANMSDIGGGEMIYAVTGFVGTNPILHYAYSGAPIKFDVDVGNVAVGMLTTAIVSGFGTVRLPVTVSAIYQLIE